MLSRKSKIIIVVIIWGSLISIIGGTAALFRSVSQGVFGELPGFEELENPKTNLASEVYSADGILLGKYFTENRSLVKYENIPQNTINALLATEDIRYYKHAGIDFYSMGRVLKGILTLKLQGGGSTISQQLSKNLFHDRPKTTIGRIKQKLNEWVIAVRLESRYTKEEIITMYFNTVEFSNNAYGIKSAAKTYFDKPVDSLNVQESAVFVGMLKAPTRFNPKRNYDRSIKRRNVVINQMAKYSYIDIAKRDSIKALPIELQFRATNHIEGLAPYFREHLRAWLKKWSKTAYKNDTSTYNIYADGLRIFTTINSTMQTYAEEAVDSHLTTLQNEFFANIKGKKMWSSKIELAEFEKAVNTSSFYYDYYHAGIPKDSIKILLNTAQNLTLFSNEGPYDTLITPREAIRLNRKYLQSGFLVVDPKNGYIKAWVGGRDYKYFKFDHVTSRRQVGSTFKPFLYAKAIMDIGHSPCDKIYDLPISFEEYNNWTARNSGKEGFSGELFTLKKCLATSTNSCSARLMYELKSPKLLVDFVKEFGINSPIDPVPSICLGAADISLIEMVGAYSAFANKGTYTEPTFISKIIDKNGNTVYEHMPNRKYPMDEQTAYIMIDMLKEVTKRRTDYVGTAIRLRKYKLYNEIGGKTGTTQNHSDGWFMGITPELVAGVWTGGEDRFMRFNNIRQGQGANMALPIWALFFQKIYADSTLGYSPDVKFEKPAKPLTIEIDCSVYDVRDEKHSNEPTGYHNKFN